MSITITLSPEGVARWTAIAEKHVQGVEGKGRFQVPSGRCGWFPCRLPWPCCWAETAAELLGTDGKRKRATRVRA